MHCRICDSQDFELVVDLKEQPLGHHFLKKQDIGKELFYPLRVVYCLKCQSAQLDCVVKKEVMYSHHTYLSGITKSLSTHFQGIASEVDRRFFSRKKKKAALDIGSNDGTQLIHYQKLGYDVLGVEASKNIADIANRQNVPTLCAFFNLQTADEINQKFDVINASGVFFHLEELHSVAEAIKKYLKQDGVFVVQFLYMKRIMENVAFDQIYHEHLLYYHIRTLNYLLRMHGLELFDAYLSPIHGGSIIGFATHKGTRTPSQRLQELEKLEEISECNSLKAYQTFSKNIEQLKEENLSFLNKCKKLGKKVYGMGAPVKGNTLLNYFGIGKNYLDCLVEKNELRANLYSPGMHLPIYIEDKLKVLPDVYYVLAWNFKKEILQNNQHLLSKGVEFYFPINPEGT